VLVLDSTGSGTGEVKIDSVLRVPSGITQYGPFKKTTIVSFNVISHSQASLGC